MHTCIAIHVKYRSRASSSCIHIPSTCIYSFQNNHWPCRYTQQNNNLGLVISVSITEIVIHDNFMIGRECCAKVCM